MFLRPADGRSPSPLPAPRRLAQPLALLLVGVVIAAVGRGQSTLPEADPPAEGIRVARSGPRRFFDNLFSRGSSTPEETVTPRNPRTFIPAPQPDPPPADPSADGEVESDDAAATAETSGDDLPAASETTGDADKPTRTAGSGLVWPRTSWEEVKQLAGRVAGSARTLVASDDSATLGGEDSPASDGPADAEASTESQSPPISAAPSAPRIVATDRSDNGSESEEQPSASSRPRKPLQPPSAAPPPKTREFALLQRQVERTLDLYKKRPLSTVDNTPWEVMHGFIAFGIPSQLRVGHSGTLVNSIGWMNMGGRCRGQVMLVPAGDLPTGLIGYGVQGHLAQYLAILAQCRVAKESPLKLQGRDYTVADLVEQEKLCCRSGVELTFSLIALSHYLQTDEVWKSREGDTWTLERLVDEELAQPVRTAACGGTHRLFALSYACQRRHEATGSLNGAFARADKFVREYQVFALSKLQNPDGSFSTEWFKYPADRADDIDRKVQTTGHILEWLVASVDQPMLYHPRIVQATSFLARALASDPNREWKIGPMGHALHALTVYQERVWGTVHDGSIAAFHGPMKAIPNRTLMLAEDVDLLEPVLVR